MTCGALRFARLIKNSPGQTDGPLVPALEQNATGPRSLSSSPLLPSLRAPHCARLRVNGSDLLPVRFIPLHSAFSPVLLEEVQLIYLH